MKGVMVLGLLLPGAVLREQLIKTTAGRLSITAGALAEQEWLESRVEPVTLSSCLPMHLAPKDSSSLNSTTVCIVIHLNTHTD